MTVYAVDLNFDEYDAETLSITCPVCCAAETGKCLQHKRTGGLEYLESPHRERVLKAHGRTEADIYGEEPKGDHAGVD